ncbi:MAG: type III pantothenate kinase [Oscillospiraceae bacterium]|nr:type III pantothenate kinase [Candidatus Equicaccousia limihippi]
MVLTVDIGNTNITLGVYCERELKLVARIKTDAKKTADEYAADLKNITALYGITEKFDGVIIGSVVPALSTAFKRAVQRLYGIEAVVVGPGVKTGLNIKVENPAQLGADLVAGAVGALKKYKMPCIMIDMGTATTVFALNGKGEFVGGAIAAGLSSTLDALTSHTAALPSVPVEPPAKAIGTETVKCMQSGLVFGTAAMIDGLVKRMEQELGAPASLVATGGKAEQIVKYCEHQITVDDDLVLSGLLEIYYLNK